jgi:spermidine synthase
MHRRSLLALLLVSGFAGLAWELLWVRLLTLSLGGTTLSFSTVLAVFFGGLAAGSRWAGRRSRTALRPVRAYAVLEFLTGALGLLLYPVMVNLGRIVAAVDTGDPRGAFLVRVLVAVVLLVPPTFLMGATLPFVSVAVVRDDEATGRGTAWIYGLNTLGACLGAWAISFVLLPTIGIFSSVAVVAGLNLVAGAAAWVLSTRPGGDGGAADLNPSAAASSGGEVLSKEARVILLAAFVGGLFATGSQVVWGRTFAIVLRGTTYALGSVLVSVLSGIAIGSLLAGWLARRARWLTAATLGAQLLQLLGVVLFIVTLPLSAYVLNTLTQADWSPGVRHHADIVVVWLSLLLPTVASGAVLPLLVAVMERRASHIGETLSRLYSANTLGCILGSVAVGFFGLPMIGSGGSLYALALLMAASISIFALIVVSDRRAVAGVLATVALATVALFPEFDASAATARSESPGVDYFSLRARQRSGALTQGWRVEGDSATAVVNVDDNGYGLTLNGLGQGGRATEPPHLIFESLLVAALPWVHAPGHDKGLVIGLGAGGTVQALAELGVRSLEVVELEDAVREAVEFIWKDESPLLRPGVALVRDDARHHLLLSAYRNPGSYDFITSMPAHPWVAPALFTREFFAIVRSNLSERGVFSTWFGAASMAPAATDALIKAVATEFPHVLVYDVPGTGAYYVLGSKAPLRVDPRRFEAFFASKAASGLNVEQLSPETFATLIAASGSARLTPTDITSTDDNAIIEFAVRDQATRNDPLAAFEIRGLPLAAIEGPSAQAFWLEMLERALGTPGGRLPLVPRRPEAIERLGTGLGVEEADLRAYLAVRLAILKGKREDALGLARALTRADLAERAMVFALASGITERSPPALRASALEGLQPFLHRADVRAFRLTLGVPDEGAALPPPASGADDSLAWIFVGDPTTTRPAPADVASLGGALLRRAAAFPSRPLAGRVEATLRAWNAPDLVTIAEQLGRRAETQRQNQRIRAALDAGAKERYREAVALLLEAAALGTLDLERIKLLLRTSLRVGDAAGQARAEGMLLARGYTQATISDLREVYRRQLEASEATKASIDAGVP